MNAPYLSGAKRYRNVKAARGMQQSIMDKYSGIAPTTLSLSLSLCLSLSTSSLAMRYALDRSADAIEATNALSAACRNAKELLQHRVIQLEGTSLQGAEYAGELRAAAAHLFAFEDRGADQYTRDARRLSSAVRLFCEYINNSCYLISHYGSKGKGGSGLGLLHSHTEWAAHAEAKSGSVGLVVVNKRYIVRTAEMLTRAARTLAEASVTVPPRVADDSRPLMWHYPADGEHGELVQACQALNRGCADLRRRMDAKWRYCGMSLFANLRSLWAIRMHVFSLNGNAPVDTDSVADLVHKARRLCHGLRLFAEHVGNILNRPPESTALWDATVWAAHPENRRLVPTGLPNGDRLTKTVILSGEFFVRVLKTADSLVDAATTLVYAGTTAHVHHDSRGGAATSTAVPRAAVVGRAAVPRQITDLAVGRRAPTATISGGSTMGGAHWVPRARRVAVSQAAPPVAPQRHPLPCHFFGTRRGCQNGDRCQFAHSSAIAAANFARSYVSRAAERDDDDIVGNEYYYDGSD